MNWMSERYHLIRGPKANKTNKQTAIRKHSRSISVHGEIKKANLGPITRPNVRRRITWAHLNTSITTEFHNWSSSRWDHPWLCPSSFHPANYAQTNQAHPRCFKQKYVMITFWPWHLKQPLAKSAYNSLLTLFITSCNDPILWEWGPASAQGPSNNSPH